ncbi:MAG: sugar ABC transporter ATP-binding protein [Treponema sp.]|nr:sugar ABC transporter ATP-binding protein [Treponema sp.]
MPFYLFCIDLSLIQQTLYIRPGTVHALMGENGAGKSTLMKCLFGIFHPDAGKVFFKGKEVRFRGTKDALETGISMINQELLNVPERTVAQNVWLGREPFRGAGNHFINHKKMISDTAALFKELDWDISPVKKIKDLSISEQQGCEIAKATSYGASVVVMDEPTSSLSEREVDHLFRIIRDLRTKGVSIIYITHRMNEVFQIADEVTVMRDGMNVGTYKASDLNEDKLISLMIGRVSTQRFPEITTEPGEIRLTVEHLTSSNPGSFKDVSFDLRKSEILGIGGLVGAQRSELVESVFGLRKTTDGGKIVINGEEVKIRKPKDAINNGIGLITEDRRGTGLFPLMSVAKNTSIASLQRYLNKFHLIRHTEINSEVVKLNKLLNTKTPGMKTVIQCLSGGNQQKVIFCRWLMTEPDILIMDEPTRGIDVGAKYEIYNIMKDLVAQGKSIIMVSSEMPELIAMSHRVAVLCNGRLTGILSKKDATQAAVMRLATRFTKD